MWYLHVFISASLFIIYLESVFYFSGNRFDASSPRQWMQSNFDIETIAAGPPRPPERFGEPCVTSWLCARSAARSLPGGELGSAETGGKDAPSFEAATATRPACVTDCANSPRHPPADAPWIMRLINMP